MNLPNKLTILRMILIIPFVIILLTDCVGIYSRWIALVIFIIASLTDMLDGKIARKYGLVTNFGKFMDPLADKILVCSAMICLVELNPDKLPAWAVIIIIAREFIAASMWGKCKTVSQMAMIIVMIADIKWKYMPLITGVIMWIAVILTVISLIDYVWKNRSVIADR